MRIHVALTTYNRLAYTKKALESILRDKDEQFRLTIWDNASTDGTPEYLQALKDPRVADIVYSKTNVGQVEAVNRIWNASDADLLGKLDNDCLVTPGWTRPLSAAHCDIDNLGVVACWHFFEADFDFEKAKHKIQEFNGHRILKHPWTCGTGVLIKKETYQKHGPIKGDTTSDYWLKLARKGMINGFYYPLVYQEHMDDWRSVHSAMKDEQGFQRGKHETVSSRQFDTLEAAQENCRRIVELLLCGPSDAKYYVGWRVTLSKTNRRLRQLIDGIRG
jgi:glycosyltransferase involved in cell wall biosynthesis